MELKIEETEREWDKKILNTIKVEKAQMALSEDMKREIKLVKKLPYKFSYVFEDDEGRNQS